MGKEGKTKEVVEDREVKQNCVWQSCMWKLVCDKERWCLVCVCERQSCVKDGVCESCVWQSCVWKMVCDKVVCEGWCVKDGLWRCVKDGVWKMVSDKVGAWQNCVKDGVVKDGVRQSVVWKMVCERWPVTVCERWCVKDGVWQSWCVNHGVWQSWSVTKLCERWCVTKLVCERWCGERWCVRDGLWRCVKDGVWQSGVWRMVWWKMVWDKEVYERWCVKNGLWRCVKDGVWQSGVKDGVSKMVCQRWCVKDGVWQSRVWQRWYVTKQRWMSPSAMPATQNEGGCHQVPRLPRKTKVDVGLCHACHVKRRWMWDCATPATQSAAASSATKPAQARHPVPWVPRLPRKTKVDVRLCHACCKTKVGVRLCHACHAKCRGVIRDQTGPSAPPSHMSATPATQNEGGCEIVPRLPCKTKVDVRLCHACHAKCRGVIRDQTGPSAPPSPMSATPAKQNEGNEGRCQFVPRLPRDIKVDVTKCHRRQSRPKGATQYHKCHACHAKRR